MGPFKQRALQSPAQVLALVSLLWGRQRVFHTIVNCNSWEHNFHESGRFGWLCFWCSLKWLEILNEAHSINGFLWNLEQLSWSYIGREMPSQNRTSGFMILQPTVLWPQDKPPVEPCRFIRLNCQYQSLHWIYALALRLFLNHITMWKARLWLSLCTSWGSTVASCSLLMTALKWCMRSLKKSSLSIFHLMWLKKKIGRKNEQFKKSCHMQFSWVCGKQLNQLIYW